MRPTLDAERGQRYRITGHLRGHLRDILGHLGTTCRFPGGSARTRIKPMSNERLRQALQNAALQPDEFADLLGADPKSVRRWISGDTVPTSRHRAHAIEILSQHIDITEHDLWPQTAAPPAGDDSRDLVAIYTRSDDIRIPDWRALLQNAGEAIDLVDITLIDILTATGTIDQLTEKARAGTKIRIAIAHPESITLAVLAEQLGQTDRDGNSQTELDRELALSRQYLDRLAGQAGIRLLAHWAEPGPATLRFDDDMLVELHVHGHGRPERPTMHLRRRDRDGLFAQQLAHVEAVLRDAEPIPSDGLDGDGDT